LKKRLQQKKKQTEKEKQIRTYVMILKTRGKAGREKKRWKKSTLSTESTLSGQSTAAEKRKGRRPETAGTQRGKGRVRSYVD